MKEILQEHGIEIKDSDKYNTVCPNCSEERKKGSQKCLQVFLEDEAVVWQCHHPDCEWSTRQVHYLNSKKKKGGGSVWKETEELKDLFMYFEGKTYMYKDAIRYPYFNDKDQLWFYILRWGHGENKLIRPIQYTGKYEFTRPSGPYLPYRIEHFDPTKQTIIVEGEKAADAAAKLSTKSNVLSWVGGSKAIKNTDWSMLNKTEIIFWPDGDAAGEEALETFKTLCVPSKLSIIDTSLLGEKEDAADITDLKKLKELFDNLIEVDLDYRSSHQYTLTNLLEEFNRKEDYIKFGFSNVDKVVQIPEPGLTVFTARTNHGKSQALINAAYHILRDTDKIVMYVSYEESGKKVLKRFLKTIDAQYSNKCSTMSYFDYDNYIGDSFINNSSKASNYVYDMLDNNRLRIYDVTTPVDEILLTMNRLKSMGKSVVAVLDYAQRMPSLEDTSRYLTLKKQMEQLVNLSNQNGQAILTAAQVTNSETGFADAARESKDIEFSADLHINVWNKPSGLASGINLHEDVEGDIVWIVKKSRQDKANGRKFGFNSMNGCDLKETKNNVEY